VEVVPPYTNRVLSFGGRSVAAVDHRPSVSTCRDEVVRALGALAARTGADAFTRREIFQEMVAAGTGYVEANVFKTIQRMKHGSPRPPYARVERVGASGFRLLTGSL